MENLLRSLAIGALTCLLMGCSSLRLYNSAKDAAATSAKADYDASKITDSIKLSRAVLDALDTKEIEAFRSVNLAERNTALLSLLSESGTSATRTVDNGFVSRFNQRVNERLILLTGSATGTDKVYLELAKLKADADNAEGAEKRERVPLVALDETFAALPACNADVAALKDSTDLGKAAALLKKPNLKPKHDGLIPNWTDQIKRVGEKCTALIEARNAEDAKRGTLAGQLRAAVVNTKAQSDAFKNNQSATKGATRELKDATKAFADAQKAVKDANAVQDLKCELAKPPGAAASAASAASAPIAASDAKAADPAAKKNDLCEALAKLKGLEDFGIKAISEERLAQINAILAALGNDGPPTADDKTEIEPALVLISTTARFARAWSQYRQAGKLPALEPLLIDKELTAAQLAYAQSGVQLAESRVQYAQAYEAATLLEVRLLAQAKGEIGSLGTPPAPMTPCGKELTVFCASVSDLLNDKKLAKAAGNGGESASRRVYRALAYLSESYSVARDRQLEAELRLIDTEYRMALGRSEASLASWNALLSVPVDQLKTYHAGGVKPAEAASLAAQVVQALAAVGIAVRID